MAGYSFTERVRQALKQAREEAADLGHEYVGTEHLLLGMLRDDDALAVTVLRASGVDIDRLREIVVRSVKHGTSSRNGEDLPYTSRAKKALELAMTEARQLNQDYVGTEHLLLGLLREAKGIGGESLIVAGMTLDGARETTVRILNSGHRPSPVRPISAVGRRTPAGEPWEDLHEPLRRIVEDAYARARASGRSIPGVADLLEATVRSSPRVAASFASRHIDVDSLFRELS